MPHCLNMCGRMSSGLPCKQNRADDRFCKLECRSARVSNRKVMRAGATRPLCVKCGSRTNTGKTSPPPSMAAASALQGLRQHANSLSKIKLHLLS
jgi:hypothetical protein